MTVPKSAFRVLCKHRTRRHLSWADRSKDMSQGIQNGEKLIDKTYSLLMIPESAFPMSAKHWAVRHGLGDEFEDRDT